MKAFTLCLLTIVTHGSANPWKGVLTPENIPNSGKDWITLDNGIEFQPGEDVDPRIDQVRRLWGTTSSHNMDNPIFVDGTETYYDDYAQAWRLLGMYIDCHYCANGGSEAACINKGKSATCQRFLLWAAYVDLEYSGNGAGEYAYYDRHRKKWNHQACEESGGRCVKMDCHEPNTHFKLLGIFKEPDYSTFLGQLFTYQGNCIWTDQEYSSMASATNLMPQGCTKANNGLYYDMKPESGGSMTIGLYTDYTCVEEYTGSITVGETVAAMANDDDSTQQMALALDSSSKSSADSWNKALDAFKICQPCKATDLVSLINHGAEVERYQNVDDDHNFRCSANGNQEINQCQQFRSNTNMYRASYKDVMMAQEQGTVASVKMGQVKYGASVQEQNDTWKRNFWSAMFLIGSFCLMIASLNRCQNETEFSALKRPLIQNETTGGNTKKSSSSWRKRSQQPSQQ